MAIFKSAKLTDQQTVLQHEGHYYAIISAGLSFDLENPQAFLGESETQKLISQYLPTVLDEGWPKQKSEVMLVGTVPHPGQYGRYRLRLQMQGIDKSVMVFGKRKWAPGPLGTYISVWDESDSLSPIDLSWNNAFGGKGYKLNPAGVGYAKGLISGRMKLNEGVALPQFEVLEPGIISPDNQDIPPAGLSPINMQDPRRLPLLGASAQYWQAEGGMPTLPAKFDFGFFQQAPGDQRRDEHFSAGEAYRLEIGERVLEGVLPEFNIKLFLANRQFKKTRKGVEPKEVHADTFYIIPEVEKGIVISRAIFPVKDVHMTEWEDTLLVLENPAQPKTDAEYEEQFLEYLENSGILKAFEVGLSPIKKSDLPAALKVKAKAEKAFASMQSWKVRPSELASQDLRVKASGMVMLDESHFDDYDFNSGNLVKKTLKNKVFNKCNFNNMNFNHVSLSSSTFVNCQFDDCQFQESLWSGCEFITCSFSHCDLQGTQVHKCHFVKTAVSESLMQALQCSNSEWVKTSFEHNNLQNSSWDTVQAVGGNWQHLDFEGARFKTLRMQKLIIKDTNFSHTTAESAMMNGADMKLIRINFANAKWQNSNLMQSFGYRLNLQDAEFSNSEWSSAKILRSTIHNTNLQDSNFPDTFFLGTSIQNAKLKGSVLEGARFKKSPLDSKVNDIESVNLKHVRFE